MRKALHACALAPLLTQAGAGAGHLVDGVQDAREAGVREGGDRRLQKLLVLLEPDEKLLVDDEGVVAPLGRDVSGLAGRRRRTGPLLRRGRLSRLGGLARRPRTGRGLQAAGRRGEIPAPGAQKGAAKTRMRRNAPRKTPENSRGSREGTFSALSAAFLASAAVSFFGPCKPRAAMTKFRQRRPKKGRRAGACAPSSAKGA